MTHINIASDHAGYVLKNAIIQHFDRLSLSYTDHGTMSSDVSVDYPIYAQKVCDALQDHPQSYGILICGSGIGMSIKANRYPHIRAALCHTLSDAILARQHNDANVICFGARVIEKDLCLSCVDIFLNTPFEGGRHQSRVELLK